MTAVQRLYGPALSDGSRLVRPVPLGPAELRLNMWVAVRGRAFRITNLRAVGGTGRLVELAGRDPVFLRSGEVLTGFEVEPPTEEDLLDMPPPVKPKRRRAVPGAGRTSPGRT